MRIAKLTFCNDPWWEYIESHFWDGLFTLRASILWHSEGRRSVSPPVSASSSWLRWVSKHRKHSWCLILLLYIQLVLLFFRAWFGWVLAFMALFDLMHCSLMSLICSWNVREWSRVTPRSFSRTFVCIWVSPRDMLSFRFHSFFHVLNSMLLHLSTDMISCLFNR